jgi:putative NIF3 family GTP cyclohydrolase 1 type 2
MIWGFGRLNAEQLFERLNTEFELDRIQEDEWSAFDLEDYVTESFKETRKGLVLNNTKEIQKVYTAVFPSEHVLDYILATNAKNLLLFTHHPMIWDTSTAGYPFRNIPKKYLEELRDREISYYAIHVPLDRNGPYSTTVSLARAFEVDHEKEFFDYFGVQVGVIGKTKHKSFSELSDFVEKKVGHQVKRWTYGSPRIVNQKVALVAGGGNYTEIVEELAETDIRTYITGVTRKTSDYEPSLRFHDICKEHEINVIAATHYSTEKWACKAVLKFFESLGVAAEFVEDSPAFTDY